MSGLPRRGATDEWGHLSGTLCFLQPTQATTRGSRGDRYAGYKGDLKPAMGAERGVPLPKPDKEGEYEIDKILGHRTRRDGKRVYLVKWKGYTYEECTWEPASHFKPHVLKAYHQSRKEAKDEQYVSSSEEEEEAEDEQKEQARPKKGNKRAKKAHLTLIDLKTGNRGDASTTVRPYIGRKLRTCNRHAVRSCANCSSLDTGPREQRQLLACSCSYGSPCDSCPPRGAFPCSRPAHELSLHTPLHSYHDVGALAQAPHH